MRKRSFNLAGTFTQQTEYDSFRGLVLDSYHAEDEMLSCSASLVRLHIHLSRLALLPRTSNVFTICGSDCQDEYMNVRAREQGESGHASAAARQHRGNAVMVWLRVAAVVELQKGAARQQCMTSSARICRRL